MINPFLYIFANILLPQVTEAAFRYNPAADSNTQEFCFETEAACDARTSAIQQAGGQIYSCYPVQTCENQEIVPTYEAPVAYEITNRIKNPLESNDIFELIRKLYRGIMMIIIPLLIVFVVYSGFIFVTAQGNDEKLKKAKANAKYAAIGIAIILGAEIIISILESLLTVLS